MVEFTTMPEQQVVIEALEEAGLRAQVKILVGGAPVTQEWADRIGADGYAPNAPEAVRVALDLVAVSGRVERDHRRTQQLVG